MANCYSKIPPVSENTPCTCNKSVATTEDRIDEMVSRLKGRIVFYHDLRAPSFYVVHTHKKPNK